MCADERRLNPDPTILDFGSSDPDPRNPFPPDAPGHQAWTEETARAEQLVHRLWASDANLSLTDLEVITYASATFDIWAHRGRWRVALDTGYIAYTKWLVEYGTNWLKRCAASDWLKERSKEGAKAFLDQLRLALNDRIQHWRTEVVNLSPQLFGATFSSQDLGGGLRLKFKLAPLPEKLEALLTGLVSGEGLGLAAPLTKSGPTSRVETENARRVDAATEQTRSKGTATSQRTRREIVNDFLEACNQVPGVRRKIIQKDIWTVARHQSPRQFQYWVAGDDKATATDDRVFPRLLEMTPEQFVKKLAQRGLL
jgi:hypothetical protein